MQTALSERYKNTRRGQEADVILRSCVHCGFCTATCPTYQVLGDELDSPRGRIYLIKELLEGKAISDKSQLHLDRCLTCRACETTCPSGVRYADLLTIGRELIEEQVPRSWWENAQRKALLWLIPHPARLSMVLKLARWLRPLLPAHVRKKLPEPQSVQPWPAVRHDRRMLLLQGCVQCQVTPNTNLAAARVLDQLGISAHPAAGCCGALAHHLPAPPEALATIKRNIDAWWPDIESGIEAIVSTASGCGVMVKDYGKLLLHDADYAGKAARVSALALDISEVIVSQNPDALKPRRAQRIAFHSPCTLQHGQKLNGLVESLLQAIGYELTPVADAHLCCGSAGAYSLLQPELSQTLLKNKLANLQSDGPELIATANIGCQIHLQSGSRIPVVHWIELLARD